MSATEFQAAVAVFVERGESACFEHLTEQGFPKSFARRVAAFLDATVDA